MSSHPGRSVFAKHSISAACVISLLPTTIMTTSCAVKPSPASTKRYVGGYWDRCQPEPSSRVLEGCIASCAFSPAGLLHAHSLATTSTRPRTSVIRSRPTRTSECGFGSGASASSN
ncbi:hypothetical protein BD414DRAFT_239637 [Trametes punicea]|nr:hypothetical protein BD414DRAFT_239637 [Trametes punicea]